MIKPFHLEPFFLPIRAIKEPEHKILAGLNWTVNGLVNIQAQYGTTGTIIIQSHDFILSTPQVTCSVSVQEKNIKEKIDFVLHIADSVTLGGFLVIFGNLFLDFQGKNERVY
jgi:hypothetical protein